MSISRKVRAAALVAAVVLGVSVPIMATQASAGPISYRVNTSAVCRYQYGNPSGYYTGSALRSYSPYGLYCSRVRTGWPSSWTALGGLNIDRYCKAKYPRSRAVVGAGWKNPYNAWWCRIG